MLDGSGYEPLSSVKKEQPMVSWRGFERTKLKIGNLIESSRFDHPVGLIDELNLALGNLNSATNQGYEIPHIPYGKSDITALNIVTWIKRLAKGNCQIELET